MMIDVKGNFTGRNEHKLVLTYFKENPSDFYEKLIVKSNPAEFERNARFTSYILRKNCESAQILRKIINRAC